MGGTEGGPKDLPLSVQPAAAAGRAKPLPALLSTAFVNESDGSALSPTSRIDLDRLAQGMTKTTTPGPVITDVAGALRAGGKLEERAGQPARRVPRTHRGPRNRKGGGKQAEFGGAIRSSGQSRP